VCLRPSPISGGREGQRRFWASITKSRRLLEIILERRGDDFGDGIDAFTHCVAEASSLGGKERKAAFSDRDLGDKKD